AEQVCEKALRKEEFARADAIARDQQPAGEARIDGMKAIARDALPRESDFRMRIAVNLPLQGRALGKGLLKARRFHAQGRSACLHHGANSRAVDAKRKADSDHALVA